MVDDIAPPKLKKVGRKRTTEISSKTLTLKEKYNKAKRSATRTLNTEKRKVEKAREKYTLAQRKAKTKKEHTSATNDYRINMKITTFWAPPQMP